MKSPRRAGGTLFAKRGPYHMARQVTMPTARVSGCTVDRLAATALRGTRRRNPSSASTWESMIRTAAAFWNPDMTGEGM